MTIRTRLAVLFVLLASLILGVAFVVVYFSAADFRKEEFLDRLHDRGNSAVKLLVQVEEVDDRLLRIMERNNPVRLPEEAIAIYNEDNEEVVRLGVGHAGPVRTSLLDSIRREGTVVRTSGERESHGFLFDGPEGGFVVITSGRDIYGRSKLRNQARVMVATFLIGLLLMFLIGRFYARRALSPLQKLVVEMHSIGAMELSKRIELGTGTDEVAQLAASFNALLTRLEAAFRAQKNFIANASHEIRTPLTAISGQLEVLLLKDRNGEEYRNALRSVLEDMHSLNGLSDRLLLMAQAETGASQITRTPVRMDELLWAARAEVLRADPLNKVQVAIEEVEEAADLTVIGNEVLLRSMLVNLLENACKYGNDHEATVTLMGSGADLSLMVEDHGQGIAQEDHSRIYDHFYRGKNTAGMKGHGIGLSLVKRIVELHDGTISLDSQLGVGSRFTVRMSKA
ncbi:MAG: HAMP domain-containing sensor histidine kinase [Flavobacteriales bacterium]|nr:HAMP domain-containing histidine kinase [Flavobacteriales bacterium]